MSIRPYAKKEPRRSGRGEHRSICFGDNKVILTKKPALALAKLVLYLYCHQRKKSPSRSKTLWDAPKLVTRLFYPPNNSTANTPSPIRQPQDSITLITSPRHSSSLLGTRVSFQVHGRLVSRISLLSASWIASLCIVQYAILHQGNRFACAYRW